MLQILSSLTLLTRLEAEGTAQIMASGVQGLWVEFYSDSTGDKCKKVSSADHASVFPIWTESFRTGTQVGNWSPDAMGTNKLTLLYGKFRGITDQYSSATAGAKLYVDANGKLTSTGSNNPVAICTREAFTQKYLGKAYTCIEFITL